MKSFVKATVVICVVLNLVLLMSILFINIKAEPSSLTQPVSRMSPTDEAAWVTQQVDNWQLTSDEKHFSEIGWITNIDEGLKKAKELNRPIFMFCVVGEVVNGRC